MLALKELLHNLKDRDWNVNPIYKIDENEARRIIEGIEAVEQVPVLDKIRTEIKSMSGDVETLSDVLDVIDKYGAESEE